MHRGISMVAISLCTCYMAADRGARHAQTLCLILVRVFIAGSVKSISMLMIIISTRLPMAARRWAIVYHGAHVSTHHCIATILYCSHRSEVILQGGIRYVFFLSYCLAVGVLVLTWVTR